jgi:DNA-binding transcriptional ArsR family regulator
MYQITESLRMEVQGERQVMFDLKNLLLDNGCIEGLSDGLGGHGASRQSIVSVLRRIAEATLIWGKPYELIRVSRLANGDTRLGFPAITLSSRTVQRALKVLVGSGLVRMFTANRGSDRYYALDFSRVLSSLRSIVSHDPKTYRARASLELLENLEKSDGFARIASLIRSLSGKVVSNAKEFKEEISNLWTKGVKVLSQKIERAKDKAQTGAKVRMQKKAEKPLFTKTGKPVAKTAMAVWHTAVRDLDKYGNYTPHTTGKMLGMMKNYLNELRELGYSEEEIRQIIFDVVTAWAHIPEHKRQLQAISQKGRPYKVMIPQVPAFDFFYTMRGELNKLFAEFQVLNTPKIHPAQEGDDDFLEHEIIDF